MTFAIGIGIGTQNSNGEWLEVFYPTPLLHPAADVARTIATQLHHTGGNAAIPVSTAQIQTLSTALQSHGLNWLNTIANNQKHNQSNPHPLVVTILETDAAPTSVPEVY